MIIQNITIAEAGSYLIEGRTDHNDTWRVLADRAMAEQIDFQGTMAKIDGRRQFRLENKLTPWSAYSFRVAGYNGLGLGQWSEPSPSYNTPTYYYVRVMAYNSAGEKMKRNVVLLST